MDIIKSKLQLLPSLSGVYLMKNDLGQIIYVGKAKSLKNRVSQYFQSGLKQVKVEKMVQNIADFDYIITPTELDALLLENSLIKKYKPIYNILLKDDKTFPYIKIMQCKYPYMKLTRKVEKDGARYFGPYSSGYEIRQLFGLIQTLFKIRVCIKPVGDKKYNRPCLNYSIGRCLAPCCYDTVDNCELYNRNFQKAIRFLQGYDSEVIELLEQKMQSASENMQFEQAIQYRDLLQAVERLRKKNAIDLGKSVEADVFGYATDGEYTVISLVIVRNGRVEGVKNFLQIDASLDGADALMSFITQYYTENGIAVKRVITQSCVDGVTLNAWFLEMFQKRVTVVTQAKVIEAKILKMADRNAEESLIKDSSRLKYKREMTMGAVDQLQNYLNLQAPPRRIECFDISNISGVDKVASMVVFIDGEKRSSHYRRFEIKTVQGANDFASMYEVVFRRLKRLESTDESFSHRPDLIVIDGGAGQLGYAKRALNNAGVVIPIIGLAEKNEEIYIDENQAPLVLPKTTLTIKLLQRIRDEAHRFAITYFRNLHRKRAVESQLLDIEGVGKARAKALLMNFKNIENIKNATTEQLAQVGGISNELANKIFIYYNGEKNEI